MADGMVSYEGGNEDLYLPRRRGGWPPRTTVMNYINVMTRYLET
jgi:hypothetical protein